MATSLKAFKIELYQEHLEDLSFLYEQRLSLMKNPELAWTDLADFEERMEAHLDALVVGEELALQVCRERAEEGDFGELFAAVSLVCRQKRGSLLSEILQKLDCGDDNRLRAVADGLKYEFPEEWQGSLVKALNHKNPKFLPILATVGGYRRLPVGDSLLSALGSGPELVHPAVISALGRLGTEGARKVCGQLLRHPDTAVKSSALSTLLRLGEQASLQQALLLAQGKPWPHLGIGLGGGQSAGSVLRQALAAGTADETSLLALGLLGDLAALKPLHDSLSDPKLAAAAAEALNLITGADLYEEIFIPEPIEEDELFEKELKALREEGKKPTRADGQPFGTSVARLSQDPDAWKRWGTEHAPRFDRNCRYRNGKPYSPACLLENLVSPRVPNRLRQLAAEELAIRYDLAFPFETDLPVRQQRFVIQRISDELAASEGRYQPGRWYFAGRLLP